VPLAHKKRGEQSLGHSHGGLSTKIHITVDGLGNPLRFCLSAGQRHDITEAENPVAGLIFEQLIADRS
jgi:hypothetical protein